MPLNEASLALIALARQAGAKPVEFLTVPQARASARQMRHLQAEPAGIATVEDRVLDCVHGEVAVRIYRPKAEGPLPLLVYFHGGGWVTGDIETADRPCRQLAATSKAVVVSVEYRLAPEHPYPAGFDDCLAAFRWAADNCRQLGCDPRRIGLVGDSAGANLAAAVALASRDQGSIAPTALVLLYPVTDFGFETPSYTDPANADLLLTRASMQWFWAHYLGAQGLPADPAYACPARAENLAGLPPTFIALAAHDPLHDDGRLFAERLEAAGVAVRSITYPGEMHGFFWTSAATPGAAVLVEDIRSSLSHAWVDVLSSDSRA